MRSPSRTIPSDPPSLDSWPTTHLPLASLTPTAATHSAFLKGVVSLQWPFSPSSVTMSLLVCEEDVRLRASKGQLRVEFRGASAREVDAKKIQIGDHVELSLEGVEFEALENATPRDVPWQIVFSTRMVMKFKNSNGWDTINVNVPQEESVVSFESPMPDEDDAFMYPPAPFTQQPTTPRRQNEWTYKRKGDLLATSPLYLQNLFEDEGYNLEADLERPRKRPRFSSSYRLVDRTPSPEPAGEGEDVQDVFDFMPEIDLEAARLAAMTNEPLVIFRDEPTPNEPLTIFQDPPNREAGGHPTWIDMPPPPLPPLDTQFNNIKDEIPDSPSLRPVPSPQLPLVSPFLHRGLSGDYVTADEDSRTDGSEALDTQEVAALRTELQSPTPTPVKGTLRDPGDSAPDDDPFAPVSAISAENSRPTSSAGESEQDSLFDEMSDREDSRARPRSRSPLPGPSPLRKVQRAKTPERSPTASRSKLRLQITSSISTSAETPQPNDTPLSTAPRTPYLYLPTPSPKVTTNDHMSFPFSPPGRLEFGRSSPEASDSLRGKKRKLLRQSLDSAPADLSTYFGRSDPHAADYSDTEKDTASEFPSSPIAEESPYKRRSSIHEPPLQRRRSTIHFKSGITTPLSDFPPLAFLSWGSTVDLIGVVSQYSPIAQAESGQKDYYMALRIVDSSQNMGIVMRIFRPYKTALPEVEVGDVVMLRSFKITTHKHRYVGASTENSAWAVWKDYGKQRPAICAGPPVEYGDEEEAYVASIGKWYLNLDPKYRENMERRPKEELVAGIKK